jgi:hypothetical protein
MVGGWGQIRRRKKHLVAVTDTVTVNVNVIDGECDWDWDAAEGHFFRSCSAWPKC